MDKIDAFGVVGVYRHIIFYMEKKGASIGDILKLLRKRFDGLMLAESRDLARKEYDYIDNFFKTLEKELGKA